MKYLILLLCLMLNSIHVFSQGNYKIEPSSIIDKNIDYLGLSKRIKKSDKAFKTGIVGFDSAIKAYIEANKLQKDNELVKYKLAICYSYSPDRKKALQHLLECSDTIDPYYYYFLALAYHNNLMFEEAKKYYEIFFDRDYEDIDLLEEINPSRVIEECNNGMKLINDSIYGIVEPYIEINSRNDEYQPVIAKERNEVFFTSNCQKKGKTVENTFFIDADCAIDEYAWNNLHSAGKKINTRGSNAVVSSNEFDNTLIVYNGKSGNGDLFVAKYKKGKWRMSGEPAKRVNTDEYKEAEGIFITENTFVFTSNRKNGLGGMDIYMTKKNTRGRWSKPENLGPSINSKYDEYICSADTETKTLYFASRGHQSMGGHDIFKTKFNKRIGWSKSENMNYPYSTPADDYSYVKIDSSSSFVCGIRPGGRGGMDIYKITEKSIEPDLHFSIVGTIQNQKDNSAIANSIIKVYNFDQDQLLAETETDASGKYYMSIETKQNVFIDIEAENFTKKQELFNPTNSEDTLYTNNYKLDEFIKYIPTYDFKLIGQVLDTKTKKPLECKVSVYDVDNDSIPIAKESSAINGSFIIPLTDRRKPYMCIIEREGYNSKYQHIRITNTDSSRYYTQTFNLDPIIPEFTFIGTIKDSRTGMPIYAEIIFTDIETEEHTSVYSDPETGIYKYKVPGKRSVIIDVVAEEYMFAYDMFVDTDTTEIMVLEKNFELSSVKKGEKIVLENILFETGGAKLAEISFETLNKLANIITNSHGIRVEISGHTDATGSLALNKRLSRQRAESVMNYLIDRGVDALQLESTGYGPSQPIDDNKTAEGRANNRRVELKIIE